MKDYILSEIKRLAAANNGIAPGQDVFTKTTGITPGRWRGVHWLRWSDALAEAGLRANEWNQRLDRDEIAVSLAHLARRLGRLPTYSEIRMEKQRDPQFPSHSTINNHFRNKAEMGDALLTLASNDGKWADLKEIVPPGNSHEPNERASAAREGLVYLLKSGDHFKIGRSEDIERRFREVTIALPEKVTLVHSIRTGDPPGIEAYWHRRFAASRANGEWFKLSTGEIKAFCKRTFQ